MTRQGDIHRVTGETDVKVHLNLDGSGQCQASTGVPFLDHVAMIWVRSSLKRVFLPGKILNSRPAVAPITLPVMVNPSSPAVEGIILISSSPALTS